MLEVSNKTAATSRRLHKASASFSALTTKYWLTMTTKVAAKRGSWECGRQGARSNLNNFHHNLTLTTMANSKKRRLSMSPSRSSQPDGSPEQKKRKSNTSAPASPAPVEPIGAGCPKTRSPEPSASDSSATLEGDAPPPPSKDKGKGVERDPLVLERLQKEEVAQKDKVCSASSLYLHMLTSRHLASREAR